VEFCRHRCLIAGTNRTERPHRVHVTRPSRSSGLVLCSFVRCCGGKLI
jgi:hypothetical protein